MALSWKHVVPWSNRPEFVQTYLDLYSQNADRQRNAVETISLWKCRATNKLSVAIESSAALTEACLQHQMAAERGELRQKDNHLRVVFTMALIRFVNHVTEKGQNKAFAQPVHKIADEFGIPEWIVRLRHDGTHGSLPCLDVLVTGGQWALSYLQDVFWSQQVKEADECTDPSRTRKRKKPAKSLYDISEIWELLQNYQKSSHKSLEDGPDSEAAREESRALRRIEHVANGNQRNNLLVCLVESGVLVPTEQQLASYNVNLAESLQAEPPKVPEVLISMWKAVFRLLQGKQLTSLLMQHLMKALVGEADPSSLTSLILLAWIRLVLLYEESNFNKSAEERESQPALYQSSINFSKTQLLSTCLQSSNLSTCTLLPLVGDAENLSVDTCGKLDELDKVYRGEIPTSASPSKDHTEEEKATQEEEKETKKKRTSLTDVKSLSSSQQENGNCWNLCIDPVDWDKIPLGMLPGHPNLPGDSASSDQRGHGYYTSTDEERRSSDDEPDTTTLEHPAKDHREESPVKSAPPKEDILKDIGVH